MTIPGQEINDVVIKLTNPVTIKGRVTDENDNPVANRKVHAHAADKLENRYYDPFTVSDANGNFSIDFLRPGSHYIQAEPFWLDPLQAPRYSVRKVKVGAGLDPGIIELITNK
jgi:protocatechuate 3,4-dioxygenase beta subunit